MKVLLSPPVAFTTTDVLNPGDLNEVWNYAKDALLDVSEKRWAICPLPLQFLEALDTPYTQATSTEVRTYRFKPPVTCVVLSASLNGNLVSSQDVQVNITDTSAVTPTGCTVPYLSTGGAVTSATNDTTDFNVDRFIMVAGTEYLITLTVVGGGTSTANRLDVVLNLGFDRWTTGSTTSIPDFQPTLLVDQAPNAVTVNANNAALTTEVNKLANNKVAPLPLMFVKHGLLSGTDADIRTFMLPRFSSSRAKSVITRMQLFVVNAATTGVNVTATLKDAAGGTLQTVTANMAGVTQKSVDSGAISISLDGAGVSPATTTDDFSITLANASAGTNSLKVYCYVWLSRA